MLNLDLIESQIKRLESANWSLRNALPYADGPAYYQDKDRLRQNAKEIAEWYAILRVCTAFNHTENAS